MPATYAQMKRMLAVIAAALSLAAAQGALADGTGWFTPDQVAQGSWEYSQRCSTCHGAQLQGTGAPALKGRVFNLQWNGKTLKDLYSYVHQQMPLGKADSLKGQEYADIVAYILAQSGMPTGNEKFTPSSPMDRVLALSDAATATGSGSRLPGRRSKLGELIGTLKQPTTLKPSRRSSTQPIPRPPTG